MEPIKIDVYADIVCPWCYIGEKRLEKALAQRPGLPVERRWRPFQLRPEMPENGLPWREFARSKFGGEASAHAAFAQVTAVGEQEGLRFDFGRVASAPNTVDGHRLILYAARHNRQWETANALFEAYFAAGRNLNDVEDLVGIATGAGLEAEETRSYLSGPEDTAEVWAAQEEAARLNVSSVPCYVFDGRYALSGARPAEAFLQAFDAVREEYAV